MNGDIDDEIKKWYLRVAAIGMTFCATALLVKLPGDWKTIAFPVVWLGGVIYGRGFWSPK